MKEKDIYTEEQMDFITEMMNIGAGNAATALSQLLQLDIKVQTPNVHILSDRTDVPGICPDLSAGVTDVKMKLVGDIQGDAYFFITDEQKPSLVFLAEKAMLLALKVIKEYDSEGKVIMVTALGQEQTREQALKLGAAGYIRKPFKADEIVEEPEKVLAVKGSPQKTGG